MKLRTSSILTALGTLAAVACQTSQDLGRNGEDSGLDAGGGDAGTSVPLGLRAFVTSAAYTGDFASIASTTKNPLAAADELCGASAAGAGLAGVWVAFLSSGNTTALDRIAQDGPFYSVDGTTLLYRNTISVGTGLVPDDRNYVRDVPDETGRLAGESRSFWTGSTAAGLASGNDCDGWTRASAGQIDGRVIVGSTADGRDGSVRGGADSVDSCDSAHPLLCIEQPAAPVFPSDKRVFVTRAQFPGNFAGGGDPAAAADALCASAARDGELGGTYHAWLSSTSGARLRADERLSEARYLLLDGRVVFENVAQTGRGARIAIDRNELGQIVPTTDGVWTGTMASGTPSPDDDCNGWSSAHGADLGVNGALAAGATWTELRARPCNESHHLYCFEE